MVSGYASNFQIASGIEQRSACQSHKLKVGGSNPSPATISIVNIFVKDCREILFDFLLKLLNLIYMKTLEQVQAWLVNQGVFEKFETNLKKSTKIDIDSFEEAFDYLGEALILNSFIWSDTPEGNEFWQEINTRFRIFWDSPRNFIIEYEACVTGVIWKNNTSFTKKDVIKLFSNKCVVEETKYYFIVKEFSPILKKI